MIVTKPPLGWNTWNTFGANINEELIIQSCDTLIESGLKDVGYEYIVIDDMWALKERDKNGRLVPDPEKFPHGMKYIADYIHSKGLKFGMYSCAGYVTCEGYPGSYQYEWIDAKTFAEWEVDFLKYDFCFRNHYEKPDVLYKRMGLALANCGRDILFSACSWGADRTRFWAKETGAHMWRSTEDIKDNWESVKKLSQQEMNLQEYNGMGCFNDMDMLVVGMNGKGHVGLGGCTEEEYKLHFSLWALLGSPLMIGCDIRDMDDATKRILTNKDVIAINQDAACRQPFFVNNQMYKINEARGVNDGIYENPPTDCAIIAKYLEGGDIAIGAFNFCDWPMGWRYCTLDMLGIPHNSGKTLELTDLWTGEKIYPVNGLLFQDMQWQAHTCSLYRAKVVDIR